MEGPSPPTGGDFADRGALRAFIGRVLSDHPRIDILVNNAGTILRKAAAQHPDQYWDHTLEINLSAQFVLTREIGGRMADRGCGKVIFIASVLSFQGGITVPGYSASKGGIHTLTMAFANEWASRGVNVNAIAPGYVTTDNTEALRQDPGRNASILAPHPGGALGRGGGLRRPRGLPRLGGLALRPRRDPARGRRLDGPLRPPARGRISP